MRGQGLVAALFAPVFAERHFSPLTRIEDAKRVRWPDRGCPRSG